MHHQAARQAVEIRRQVLDVLVGQRLDLASHDGVVAAVGAVAALVADQRVLKVILVLAGQLGIAGVDRGVVILAMAGEAAVFVGDGLAGGNIAASDGGERQGGTEPVSLYTSPSPRDRQKSRMPSSA